MAELLSLRGGNALSPFRITKLLSNLAGTRISGLTADFWHFVRTERELSASERATLERILTYGPHSEAHADSGELLLVMPRPGTISPWASKATDIAHSCGLGPVLRIERGIAYRVATRRRQRRFPRRARGAAATAARPHDRRRVCLACRRGAAIHAVPAAAAGHDRPARTGPGRDRGGQRGAGARVVARTRSTTLPSILAASAATRRTSSS